VTLVTLPRCETEGCTNQGPTYYLRAGLCRWPGDKRCLPCAEWITCSEHAWCSVHDLRLHVPATVA
jgi:hypothetical protein